LLQYFDTQLPCLIGHLVEILITGSIKVDEIVFKGFISERGSLFLLKPFPNMADASL
jgi:hypothetical protein